MLKLTFHFVRDMVVRKSLGIRFLPSKDQLAYVFTKPISLFTMLLPCGEFEEMRHRRIYSQPFRSS
jgi:hypothetical protein